MMWFSGILWIAFIVYWSAAARGAAPTVSAESAHSRQMHVLLMYGALLLAFVRFPPLSRRVWPESMGIAAVGLVIQAGGFLLAAWARRYLGRNWSGEITAKAGHQLVRTGPYRLVRHPIYTAMLAMLLGTTLVSGEWHALVALAMLGYAYWRKIRLEERNLLDLFGDEYVAYRRASGAVLPWVL
jgi:protein-S-isoprenylcysteine O-methyltransferase Ste14